MTHPIAILLQQIVEESLHPTHLSVTDQSAQHAGHNPEAAAGGTHFTVIVAAEAFRGLSRLQRHQLVYRLLASVMQRIHALSLHTLTPEEYQKTHEAI